jgi:phage repressor protein C with HTH and peptisase S24 domain
MGLRDFLDRGIGQAVIADQRRRRDSLLTAIREDKTISDISRAEFSKSLMGEAGLANLGRISGEFAQAKEGRAPKFKERQLRQEQQKLVADRPGRRQTILTSGANRGRTQQVGSMLTGKLGAV